MAKKPAQLADYYKQNSQQFIKKTVYSKFCIIFWVLFIILAFIFAPTLNVISFFLFPLFLYISRRHYYFNVKNNHKIVPVVEQYFESYLMKKDEIIDCFLGKRFVRLKQLLNEPEDFNYAEHDFPDDSDEIDKLSDEERSYFDSIYLEIDEEEKSQRYYCILWQQRENPKEDEDDIIGLTDILILENSNYHLVKTLIAPEKIKKSKSSSIVS